MSSPRNEAPHVSCLLLESVCSSNPKSKNLIIIIIVVVVVVVVDTETASYHTTGPNGAASKQNQTEQSSVASKRTISIPKRQHYYDVARASDDPQHHSNRNTTSKATQRKRSMAAGKRTRPGRDDRRNLAPARAGVAGLLRAALLLVQLASMLAAAGAFVATPGGGGNHACRVGTALRAGTDHYNANANANANHHHHHHGEPGEAAVLSRRSALMAAARSASALAMACSIAPPRSMAAEGPPSTTTVPVRASWKAVDGLNTMEEETKNFVGFDASAYQAMINDKNRTPMFYKAMAERIDDGRGAKTVLDLGTGPFAIFAIRAAELGAEKVYAIEANPRAASMARETVRKKGFEDVITVLEGFSTDVSLPNGDKADLIVAEIIGSIASEEGVVATIADAHRRFARNPTSDSTWIPSRVQTYAAPASYTLHNLFGPPGFDWSKLDGDPVRFNCRDEGLQLLSDPQIVEDISFANILDHKVSNRRVLDFAVDEARTVANTETLVAELQANKLGKSEALRAADATGHSFSGLALWPRLVLGSTGAIDSRRFPDGGHQRSHWQTVLPIMGDRPVPVRGGDAISIRVDFRVQSGGGGTTDLQTPATYKLEGTVVSSAPVGQPEPVLM